MPQIDFVMINENIERWSSIQDTNADGGEKLAIRKKFKRAIRRLVLLSRAARKQGNDNFNIGGLVFEITREKPAGDDDDE